MAQYATAFREFIPDTIPSEFTSRWSGSDASAKVRHPVGDREPRLSIDGDGLWSWDIIDSDTSRADAKLRMRFSILEGDKTAVTVPVAAIRGSFDIPLLAKTGYVLELRLDTPQLKLSRWVTGIRTHFATGTPAEGPRFGEPLELVFEVTGTTVRAKMWWVASGIEPTSWDVSATDANISAAGWVGINNDDTFAELLAVHYFSVGTGGDEPIPFSGAGGFGRHTSELITDPESNLEYGVDISFANRTSGTENPLLASTLGRVLGPQDLPALDSAQRWLLEEPEVSVGLAGDPIHDGESNRAFSVRLNNEPSGPVGTVGPHDSRESTETVAGRDVTVLAAEESAASWRSFSRLLSGKAHGNPVAEGNELSVDVLSSSGRFDRKLETNRYVGTASCLRQMTNGGLGHITATHIAAYDLTSFVLAIRFRLESLSGLGSYFFLKQATDRNFWFLHEAATGVLKYRHSAGGTPNVGAIDGATKIEADRWYWAAVGVLASERAYMLLDGELDGEDLSPGVPDTPTTSVLMGQLGESGFQICDARILGEYREPDEVREEMSRIPVAAPSHYKGWWILDETSGATATDHSSAGNDGSINGVENTDYERFPTDLGDPNLEGQPMPMLHGDVDHLPAQLIDLARERYRLNSRDIVAPYPTDNAGEVYSRGVVVTEVDEGDGVISFATAQDQPVTAQSIYGLDGEHPTTLPKLAEEILTQRFGLTSSDFDQAAIERLHELLPWGAGWFRNGEPPATVQALREVLSPAGLHWREDPWSRVVFDRLHPPIPDGPTTNTSMEVMGTHLIETNAPALIFDNVTAIPATGDIGSITLWVYPMPRASRNVLTWAVQPPIVGLAEHNLAVGYMYDSLTPVLITPGVVNGGGDEYLFGNRPLTPWKWNFISVQVDLDTGLTRSIHNFVQGESTIDSASEAVTGSLTGDTDVVRICGGGHPFMGAIQDVRTGVGGGVNDVLIPLSEGSGLAEETVSGSKCALRGARWAPVLELNLDQELDIDWEMLRYVQPASEITLGYRPNYAQLRPSATSVETGDIASSVSLAATQRFIRERLNLPSSESPTPGESLEPLIFTTNTTIHAAAGAEQTLCYFQARLFPDGRIFGKINGLDHRLLALQRGDQIRVTGARHGLSSGRSVRVIEKVPGSLVVEG